MKAKLFLKQGEDHAEPAGREQLVAVTVVLEGARLPYQPVDDVTVINSMLQPPSQAWHLGDLLLPVPDLHMVHKKPRLYLLADQPARHRVRVAVYVDEAARVHLDPIAPGRFHTPLRQLPHPLHLFSKPLLPPRVQPLQHRSKEATVFVHAGEVHTAAQHQLLRHRPLEAMVPLLNIAVLVAMSSLSLLALQAVKTHQSLVAIRKLGRIAHVVDRRRKPVGAMTMRYFAQRPQSVLQPFAQALEAF